MTKQYHINGVTITPRWKWTRRYLAEVRATLKAHDFGHPPDHFIQDVILPKAPRFSFYFGAAQHLIDSEAGEWHLQCRAVQYAVALARQNGVELPDRPKVELHDPDSASGFKPEWNDVEWIEASAGRHHSADERLWIELFGADGKPAAIVRVVTGWYLNHGGEEVEVGVRDHTDGIGEIKGLVYDQGRLTATRIKVGDGKYEPQTAKVRTRDFLADTKGRLERLFEGGQKP